MQPNECITARLDKIRKLQQSVPSIKVAGTALSVLVPGVSPRFFCGELADIKVLLSKNYVSLGFKIPIVESGGFYYFHLLHFHSVWHGICGINVPKRNL